MHIGVILTTSTIRSGSCTGFLAWTTPTALTSGSLRRPRQKPLVVNRRTQEQVGSPKAESVYWGMDPPCPVSSDDTVSACRAENRTNMHDELMRERDNTQRRSRSISANRLFYC